MSGKVAWAENVEFAVCSPMASFNNVGGIYIFAGVNQANQWVPHYIGQASSLAERLSDRERWPEAQRLGATHIHAKVVQQQRDRDTLEALLIQMYQPSLNTQLK
jgi:excinuclease UvrABC nuclease subunit